MAKILHILAAKEAPVAVIIRRLPRKLWHIIRWNLQDDSLVEGSWFKGRLLDVFGCDLSWDGTYMAYSAATGNTAILGGGWTGICEPPRLKTLVEWHFGGAVWRTPSTIYREAARQPDPPRILGHWPGENSFHELQHNRYDWFPILHRRLHRDGYRPVIHGALQDPFDERWNWKEGPRRDFEVVWECPAFPGGPKLRIRYAGYVSGGSTKNFLEGTRTDGSTFKTRAGEHDQNRVGYVFRFDIEEFPDLLGPRVDWATWSNDGDLLYAISGSVFKLTRTKGYLGDPVEISLDHFVEPWKRIEFDTST